MGREVIGYVTKLALNCSLLIICTCIGLAAGFRAGIHWEGVDQGTVVTKYHRDAFSSSDHFRVCVEGVSGERRWLLVNAEEYNNFDIGDYWNEDY